MRGKFRPPSALSRKQHRQRSSRPIVHGAIVASLITTSILIAGFFYGIYAAFGEPVGGKPKSTSSDVASTSNINQSKMIHLVALGDSLAHGFGDVTGRGFVGDISRLYRSQGDSVIQSNFGIDGLTSQGLINEIKQSSVQSLLRTANVILVSIGGNDLNNAAGLPTIQTGKIAAAKHAFATHLTTILTQIRSINQTAPIMLVGLYNPYTNVTAKRQQTDAIVQDWNVQEERISGKFSNSVVVRTFDLFQLHSSTLLYADHFHPNKEGYQLIANRIWQDLRGVSS